MKKSLYVLSGVLVAALSQAQMGYGIDWNGGFHAVDIGAGTATQLTTQGASGWNSMTFHGGRLLSYQRNGGGMWSFDTSSGAATFVSNFSGDNFSEDVRGMTSAGGVLYAAQDSGFGSNDALFSLNISTGVSTLIGDMGDSGIQGLASHADGRTFAYSVSTGLLAVDLTTGGTSVLGNPGLSTAIQTLFFDGNTLYGAGNANVYRLDMSSGAATLHSTGGSGWTDFRGMEAVPEPGIMGVLALGLLAGLRRKKKA